MRRVLVPLAAPGFSALGLLTADHVVDNSRGYITPWREADPAPDRQHGRRARAQRASTSCAAAGVPGDRIRLEWYGQPRLPGPDLRRPDPAATRPTEADRRSPSLEAAVAEFHRRHEEARLIEARAQEPTFRGLRLTATGHRRPARRRSSSAPPPRHPSRSAAGGCSAAGRGSTTRRCSTATRCGPAPRARARGRPVPLHDPRAAARATSATVLPNGDALVEVGPLL